MAGADTFGMSFISVRLCMLGRLGNYEAMRPDGWGRHIGDVLYFSTAMYAETVGNHEAMRPDGWGRHIGNVLYFCMAMYAEAQGIMKAMRQSNSYFYMGRSQKLCPTYLVITLHC